MNCSNGKVKVPILCYSRKARTAIGTIHPIEELAPPAMPMRKVNPVSPALIVSMMATRSLDATISRKAFLPSARTVAQALEEMVKATTPGEERRAVTTVPML
jgi:hypothetical protein